MKLMQIIKSWVWPLVVLVIVGLFLFGIFSTTTAVKEVDSLDNDTEEVKSKLVVYNWEDYFGSDTLKEFSERYNIEVELKTFESEEELHSQVSADSSRFDVAICSDNEVEELIGMKLLEKVNLSKITNLKNIYKKFLDPKYDPGNTYSIPYLWGTSGIIYNKKFVGEAKSSSIFWDKRFTEKSAVLNERSEVLGLALKAGGFSLNTRNISEIQTAGEKILSHASKWHVYDLMTIQQKMIKEEIWVGLIYSGEGIAATVENPNLEYLIPDEGAPVWVDAMVIPKNANNKGGAELFINYILEAEVSAKIANELYYANCNEAAYKFTLPEIRDHKGLYPPKEVLERCEVFMSLKTADNKAEVWREMNRIWAKFRKVYTEKAGK